MNTAEANEGKDADWIPATGAAIVSSLVAGLLALVIIQTSYPFVAREGLPDKPDDPTPEVIQKYLDAEISFRSSNYAISSAIIGALLGLSIGFGTTARKRLPSGIAGAVAGAVGGAMAGYFAGYSVAETLEAYADQSLIQSGGLHLAVWGAIAVCIAFTIAMLQGGAKQALNGLVIGVLCGIMASAGWNVIGSVAFSGSNLIHMVPEPLAERVVWILVCSMAVGLGLSVGFQPAGKKPQAEPEMPAGDSNETG